VLLEEPCDAGERLHKDLRHFFTLQIARCQDECRDARFHERQPFNMPIPDAMIFGQDNPATLPNLGEPVFILSIGRKMVVVDVERGAGLTERCGHALLPQRTIEEKDGGFRRLRPRVRT